MARVWIVLSTVIAVACTWALVWPVEAAGCLPNRILVCEYDARSLVGLSLGVPAGDSQIAICVIAAVAAVGALLFARFAPPKTTSGQLIHRVTLVAAVLGLLLIAAIALEIGTGGNPDNVTVVATLAGTILLGAGVAGLLTARAARHRVLGRALVALGVAGAACVALTYLLAQVEFFSQGSATYVPLDPGVINFAWPTVATFVLVPALGATGLVLALAAIAVAIAHAARHTTGRLRGTS